MSSKFYKITIPENGIYNTRECMIKYYVKKYGFNEFLAVIASRKISNNEYLVSIPNDIADDFINTLKLEENCTANILNSGGSGNRNRSPIKSRPISNIRRFV